MILSYCGSFRTFSANRKTQQKYGSLYRVIMVGIMFLHTGMYYHSKIKPHAYSNPRIKGNTIM